MERSGRRHDRATGNTSCAVQPLQHSRSRPSRETAASISDWRSVPSPIDHERDIADSPARRHPQASSTPLLRASLPINSAYGRSSGGRGRSDVRAHARRRRPRWESPRSAPLRDPARARADTAATRRLTATIASAPARSRCFCCRFARIYGMNGSVSGHAGPARGGRQRVIAAGEHPGHDVTRIRIANQVVPVAQRPVVADRAHRTESRRFSPTRHRGRPRELMLRVNQIDPLLPGSAYVR